MVKSDEVLLKIQSEWGENWDQVVDFFGAEIAQEIEDAIAVINPDVKAFKSIPGVNCNEEPTFNEHENL